MNTSTYSERLNDIAILHLNTQGFEALSFEQKQLAFHLAQAGLWGRAISLQQGSKYNLPFIAALVGLFEKINDEQHELKNSILWKQLHDSLFIVFAHNGIYHNLTGQKLSLPLTIDVIEEALNTFDEAQVIRNIWFQTDIPQLRTVQSSDVDVVALSGGNFYQNLTTEEVQKFRTDNYPLPQSEQVPPYGFNEQLVKQQDGTIERNIICANGMLSKYVQKIIESLQLALPFSENEQQKESISTLIDFYKTGSAEDFDRHCCAWTKDKNSNIYFINGLIESYDDPLGIGCTFESIVAFKNPIQTAKVNKIIENIQWFEENLPIDKELKKEKAQGLSASSITVVSMAGETSPTLPLGINLPNSDWIRKVHGSKSVNLENVSSGRSTYEVPLREALYLPHYHDIMEKYLTMTNSLHTDLHEIAGHGSGQMLPGCSAESIGAFYSTIEEARADLVALYFIASDKLKDIGVYDKNVDVQDCARAQYVSYLTNGAFAQLRRVELGNDLTQAHLRNRQLISNWILQNSEPSKICLSNIDGAHFIEVFDVPYLQQQFGKLLSIVQRIKSTGNFEDAKNLVMTFGTKVNQALHSEILTRIESLNLPKVTGFITPQIIQNSNDFIIENDSNFLKHQLCLHKNYV